MEGQSFKTLLAEAMDTKNINHEKLAQFTGIPKHFIIAIENADISHLPSAPYVKNYIKKISEVLDVGEEDLWKNYEKDLEFKQSGEFDKMPSNRFALRKASKKKIALIIFIIILLTIIIFNYKNLIGLPYLEINNPINELASVENAKIMLAGKINPQDKLTINGTEASTDTSGNFQYPFNLQPGLNTIEFTVKKLIGKEKTVVKQIMYEPINQNTEPIGTSTQP